MNNLDFVACLALYQNRRDKAIGISHISQKQKGLVWYYNFLLRDHLKKATVYGALQAIQSRMSQIMQEAQTSTIERQKQLLLEAMRLREQSEAWHSQISNM